jgi:hypothetical protein
VRDALSARTAANIANEVSKAIRGTRAIVGVDMVSGRPNVQLSKDFLDELLLAAATKGIQAATTHHTQAEAATRAPNAKLRRGFLRLWIALSALWLTFIAAVLFIHRHDGNFDWIGLALFAFGLPIAILAAAIVMTKLGMWVWSGFGGGP